MKKILMILGLAAMSTSSANAAIGIDPQVNLTVGRTLVNLSSTVPTNGYGYFDVKVNFFNFKLTNDVALNTTGLGLGLTHRGNANILLSPVGLSYMNWLGFQLDYSFVPYGKEQNLGLSFNFNILYLINRS